MMIKRSNERLAHAHRNENPRMCRDRIRIFSYSLAHLFGWPDEDSRRQTWVASSLTKM